MKKGRTFKITEEQLREAEEELFSYFGKGTDIKPFDGLTDTNANGNLSNNEYGTPKTSDDVDDMMIPQAYCRYRMYSHMATPPSMRESVDPNDKNGDGVDDFYNNDELDLLGDNDDTNNLIKVPQGIQNKADILVNELQKVSPKVRAIVLNKFIEQANMRDIPMAWKKELSKKIML